MNKHKILNSYHTSRSVHLLDPLIDPPNFQLTPKRLYTTPRQLHNGIPPRVEFHKLDIHSRLNNNVEIGFWHNREARSLGWTWWFWKTTMWCSAFCLGFRQHLSWFRSKLFFLLSLLVISLVFAAEAYLTWEAPLLLRLAWYSPGSSLRKEIAGELRTILIPWESEWH